MSTIRNIRELDPKKVYTELVRAAAISVGIYVHAAGTECPQQPHSEDEVYFVVEGSGRIHVEGNDYAAQAGSIIFVPAGAEHYFHSVISDMQVLVCFAPAEGTNSR